MTDDKRYQIFISSTFRDLLEERQAVLKAVLELDHMPAGMELFPAIDENAWQLIKDVIDSSDYYILIIGGRYGSLDEEGIGYTEKEYDYAVSTKKPVVSLLYKNPDNLPREKTETDENIWEKLREFRKKVEANHTCVYWTNKDELKAQVIIGLTSSIKRYPGIGWIRADQMPSGTTMADILALRRRIEELQAELEKNRTTPPPGTQDLLQGEDHFVFQCEFNATINGRYLDSTYKIKLEASFNQIFAAVAPIMINEVSDNKLKYAFEKYFKKLSIEALSENEETENWRIEDIFLQQHDIDTCIIQFRALGLIRESQKQRSVRDTNTYWTLTPFGDQVMVQLRALKNKSRKKRSTSRKIHKTE